MTTFWVTQKTYSGFGLWVANNIVLVPVFMLYVLRGIIPDFWSIVIANTLLTVAAVLRLEGIKRFLGTPHGGYLPILIPLVVFSLLSWYTFQQDNILARTVVISAALAYCVFYSAWLLIVHTQPRTKWLNMAVACLFLIIGVIMTVRVFVLLQGAETPALLASTPINEVYYVSCTVARGWPRHVLLDDE